MLFFLSLLLVCVLSVPTFANAGNDSQEISVLRTIALNTPAKFGHSQEWDVVQETPLYDVNDTLIAYCFDLIAQDSSGITSYVIVSVGDTQFPILLFGYEEHPHILTVALNVHIILVLLTSLSKMMVCMKAPARKRRYPAIKFKNCLHL